MEKPYQPRQREKEKLVTSKMVLHMVHWSRKSRMYKRQLNLSSVLTHPDEPLPWALDVGTPSSRSLTLTRSSSCRPNLMTGSSSPPEKVEQNLSTPPNGFEKDFPGRPESRRRWRTPLNYSANMPRLSRTDSQSSAGSALDKTSADEDITSIQTFVAGLKQMAKLQYEKQLVDDQVRTCLLLFSFHDRFKKMRHIYPGILSSNLKYSCMSIISAANALISGFCPKIFNFFKKNYQNCLKIKLIPKLVRLNHVQIHISNPWSVTTTFLIFLS